MIPIRGSHNEIVCIGNSRSVLHLFQRRSFHPKSYIVIERIVEKNRLLVHITHERPQFRHAIFSNVMPIKQYRTKLHIIEAG